jgi:hypothetical protein
VRGTSLLATVLVGAQLCAAPSNLRAVGAPGSAPSVLDLSFPPPEIPEWCRALPRPEYKTLERVTVSDPWFEVYKAAKGVYAIYEPHQSEETIGYLILGDNRALLFDTGMGISDLKKITAELTKVPIVVLNSHTHDDHVGGNWQFETVYGMDTDFTRTNAKGSRVDAQAEIAADQICGDLPGGFDAKTTQQNLGAFRGFCTMATKSTWEIVPWKFSQLRDIRRTLSACWIAQTACCSPATLTIRRRFGCFGRRPTSTPTSRR